MWISMEREGTVALRVLYTTQPYLHSTSAHDKISVLCDLEPCSLLQLGPASICIMFPSIPPMPPCCRAPNHNSSTRSSIVLKVGSRRRVDAYSLRRILTNFRLECSSKACGNKSGSSRRLQRITESRGQIASRCYKYNCAVCSFGS